MAKALLFDLDGTLAETGSLHYPAWVETLEPYGIEVTRDFYQRRIGGRVNRDIVEELLPDLSPDKARQLADDKEARFREKTGELEPLPGLLDFVGRIREKGLPAVLVTNAPEENVRAILQALGLYEAFDPVVLAEEVGAGKPDPAPYLEALRRLDLPAPDTVTFEDSPSGLASAMAAKIPTVGIASTHEPEELRKGGAYLIVQDFTDPELEILLHDSS